jgi:uncharacterized protein
MFQPLRQCLVCKSFAPKQSLIRLVKLKGKTQIFWDKSQKSPGKGIYLCSGKICIKKFLQEKKFKKFIGAHLEETTKLSLDAFQQEGEGHG